MIMLYLEADNKFYIYIRYFTWMRFKYTYNL